MRGLFSLRLFVAGPGNTSIVLGLLSGVLLLHTISDPFFVSSPSNHARCSTVKFFKCSVWRSFLRLGFFGSSFTVLVQRRHDTGILNIRRRGNIGFCAKKLFVIWQWLNGDLQVTSAPLLFKIESSQ
jgi:hypothetical protein